MKVLEQAQQGELENGGVKSWESESSSRFVVASHDGPCQVHLDSAAPPKTNEEQNKIRKAKPKCLEV